MSLWAEIKQRRITQIVFTYLAGGYVVLTVIDQVVDREVLPLVVYEVALTLYLVGILAALVVGWYHGEKGEQKAPLVEVVALAVIAAVGLGASTVVVRNATSVATLADAVEQADLSNLGVLYFEPMDEELQSVADGITEGLIDALREVSGLTVTSRNAAATARALHGAPLDSIAALLDVGAIVTGQLFQGSDEINVQVRLVEGATGFELSREQFRWPMERVSEAGSELARRMALTLREDLGLEIRFRERQERAPNNAAWLRLARAEKHLKDAVDAVQHGDAEAAWNAFGAAQAEAEGAADAAPEWAEPVAFLARITYERYIFAGSADELIATLDEAARYARAALEIDPAHPGALEWRGTARYRRWLLQADDDETLERLLDQARADLERAATLDRHRASVQSTLSHLYYQTDDWQSAVLAAREAYREDAFLDVADGVLWRLFTANYDLGEADRAAEACDEGGERFPFDYRFVQCSILLMTMPTVEPRPSEAWALYDELLPLLTENREHLEVQSRLMIAAIVGRAGLADSAQAVLARASDDADRPGVDPLRELDSFEAAMRSVIGDVDGAVETLTSYVVGNDQHAPGRHWWWTNVEQHPGFQRLRQLH